MERIEHDIGLHFGQPDRNVAVHVDAGDLVPLAFQSLGNALPAHQRDRPFVRPAAHQDRDVEFGESHFVLPTRSWSGAPANMPTRWISHSSAMPELSFTRSEESRVGKVCVRTCRYRGATYPKKTN